MNFQGRRRTKIMHLFEERELTWKRRWECFIYLSLLLPINAFFGRQFFWYVISASGEHLASSKSVTRSENHQTTISEARAFFFFSSANLIFLRVFIAKDGIAIRMAKRLPMNTSHDTYVKNNV